MNKQQNQEITQITAKIYQTNSITPKQEDQQDIKDILNRIISINQNPMRIFIQAMREAKRR